MASVTGFPGKANIRQESGIPSHAPRRKAPQSGLFADGAETVNRAKRKQHFLLSLRGNSGKFKRYRGLPLRYAGGKSLAVGHVVSELPAEVTRLVSPFFGGGSVEIACNRELGIEVVGYDIFQILVNYWQAQIKSPQQLADKVSAWKPDKETYQRVKERLKGHWTGGAPIADKLDLAAHYWFNHNLSYGPGFLGWASKIYEDAARVQRLIDKVRNFNCGKLSVRHGEFQHILPKHSGDFLYCDPPYFLDGDSKMFRGIYPQRNFPIHHNGFDHAKLHQLLMAHKGGFILSYNDCATIREWYAPFKIIEVEWQYTLGQGEARIGKNRIENGTHHHTKKSHELLIVSHG